MAATAKPTVETNLEMEEGHNGCPIFYQKKMCNTWLKYNLKNIVIPLSLLKKVNLIHLYLMFL